MVHEKVVKVRNDLAEDKKIEGQKTIFHEVITDESLRPEEKTVERLEAEGVGLIGAGYLDLPFYRLCSTALTASLL